MPQMPKKRGAPYRSGSKKLSPYGKQLFEKAVEIAGGITNLYRTTGIHKSTLYAVWNGERAMTVDHARAIEKAVNHAITARDLLKDGDENDEQLLERTLGVALPAIRDLNAIDLFDFLEKMATTIETVLKHQAFTEDYQVKYFSYLFSVEPEIFFKMNYFTKA